MHFFKSSIIAATLSSLMLLKVEGEPHTVTFRFAGGTYKPDSGNWTLVKVVTSPSENCFVTHPNSDKHGLEVWYEGGELHLKNTKKEILDYKVRDAINNFWTFDTTITPDAEHKLNVNKAEIWFAKYFAPEADQ